MLNPFFGKRYADNKRVRHDKVYLYYHNVFAYDDVI